MKDKKGFTLVELLAVIAILAIIVLLSLPNVLKIFNEAKKGSFVTEAQEIAKTSTTKFIQELLKGNKVNKISSDGENKLNLSGGDVDYYIELDNKGNTTYLEVTNDSFCLQTDKDYKSITKEDVTDGRCDPSNRLTEEQKEIARIQSMSSTVDTLNVSTFKSFVESNSPTEIYFVISGHEDGEDISTNTTDTEPIYAWMDGTKMYVSAKEENERITLPSDSSILFKFKNISKIDVTYLNTSNVTNMSRMFMSFGYNYSNFEIIGLKYWDTSNVTDMSIMFDETGYNADNFEIIGLKYWDTSNVTDMSYMFALAGNQSITFNLDLSNFDTSKVTNLRNMFDAAGYSATIWNIGNINTWNTSKVTNMSCMFREAAYNTNKFNLNVSNWNTSKVESMACMFEGTGYSADNFEIIGLNNWNTSSVTNMSCMFFNTGYSATNFNLDLSKWNTSNVTDMSFMFYQTGYNATNFSIKIKNSGRNTTSELFGSDSVYAAAPSNKSFTLVD